MPGYKRNSRTRKRIKIQLPSKVLKIIAGIFLPIIVILIGILTWRTYQFNTNVSNKNHEKEEEIYKIFKEEDYSKIEGEKYVETDKKISIIALGDISYNHDLFESLYDNKTGIYVFSDYVDKVRQYVEIADYTIANLDANLTQEFEVGKGKTNIPEDMSISLRDMGIDILNMANRNSNDLGKSGIQKTLEKLDNLKIEHTGTARAEIESKTIEIVDIRGIQVAFLSYTENLNNKLNSNESYLVNRIDKNRILEDVKLAKEKGAEFIFVSLEWGTKENTNLIDTLINNGVDFILGNKNTGTVEKIEIIENKEGKHVGIAHNTGNFIAMNNTEDSKIEISLLIELTKSVQDNQVRITKVNYTPMYLLDRGKDAEYRYMLVDMKQEIERYEANVENNLTKQDYENVIKGLNKLEERTK